MNTPRRNAEIESLRAIAVLSVFLHHMLSTLSGNGVSIVRPMLQHLDYWFGVDLFFAISGYVIARNLVPSLLAYQGQLSKQLSVIVAFWIRRAWRLLPSAWLWLGLILLAVVCFNQSGAYGSLHANLLATSAGLFNYANIRFGHAFFHYEYGASFVYWSLSLEEQFYLVLPLLVLCFRRRIDLFMLVVVVAQINLFHTPMLMAFRTDAMAWGVLLATASLAPAYAAIAPRYLLRLGRARWVLLCLLWAALAVLASPALVYWPPRISAIAATSAVLVWIASYDEGYLLPHGRIRDTLAWLGARSYALYLIHVPVFFAIREMCHRTGIVLANNTVTAWVFGAVAICLTILLAQLNYRYVEQPLRRRGHLMADRFLARKGLIEERRGAPSAIPCVAESNKNLA